MTVGGIDTRAVAKVKVIRVDIDIVRCGHVAASLLFEETLLGAQF